MTRTNRLFSVLSVFGLAAILGGALVARSDDDKAAAKAAKADVAKERAEKIAKLGEALGKQKVSLAEAVAAAEKETGGKAFDAELEHKKKIAYFGVKILKDGRLLEVNVSGDAGKVTRTEDVTDDESDDDDASSAEEEGDDKKDSGKTDDDESSDDDDDDRN